MTDQARLDQLAVNTIRTLSMDAVQAANSGHPGTPMALAPVAYCLWQRFLRFDPDNPIWPNRDRFVLSCGHASMLIYSLLHLAGVKAVNPQYERLGELSVKLDDIKRFRQLDSKCAGHPEYRWTSGIETRAPGRRAGHQRGHGDRQPLAGETLQPARLRSDQNTRSRTIATVSCPPR
jgi:transketolase